MNIFGQPQIEGIDSSDVRERLNDDVDLFRSMLKRLLDEFSDIAIPVAAPDPAALAAHAGRLHKLRGSAGMLGAKAIQSLAGDAEAACASGEVEQAAHLATSLATLLHQLRCSAAPAFTAALAQVYEPARPSSGELEPQVLHDFVGLLRQHNLCALDRFSAISPQLRQLLGKELYERVRDDMDNLRFTDAANTLEARPR